MIKTVSSLGCSVVLGLAILFSGGSAAMAQEKKKETQLSERTVRVIMGTAFAGIPDELPDSSGKMVKIDRSDPKKFLIPMEDARNIIIRSVLSARATLCGLEKLERAHFQNIMRAELARKKWTPSQMTYIDILHATTGLYLTGSQAVGEDAKKDDSAKTDIKTSYNCNDQEKTRVKAAVENDMKKTAQAN